MSDLITGITRNMRHLSQRQQVLAENIAHSETPGFKARDVRPPSFAELVDGAGKPGRIGTGGRPQVRLTAAMTALGARGSTMGGPIVRDRDTAETKPNGNNVTLEDQLLKLGQVQADFATMTNLYRKSQGLIQSALGRKGGA